MEDYTYGTLVLDNCQCALIGIGNQHTKEPIAVYCYQRLVKCYMKEKGLTYLEAVEDIDFNVSGSWLGERTPLILHSCKCSLCKEQNIYID